MRRLWPLAAGAVLTFAAYALQAAHPIARALACSCVPPAPLAQLPAEAIVLTGTVGAAMVDRIPIAVDGWYKGPGAAELVWLWRAEIPDGRGGIVRDTCGRTLAAGAHYFLVVHGTPPEPLSTSNCSPGALVASPEGQALVAEAILAFGAPRAPPPAEPPSETAPGAPFDLSPWLGDGVVWAAVASGVGLLLLAAVALVARRRPAS